MFSDTMSTDVVVPPAASRGGAHQLSELVPDFLFENIYSRLKMFKINRLLHFFTLFVVVFSLNSRGGVSNFFIKIKFHLEWRKLYRFQIVLPGQVSILEEEVGDLGGVQLRANHPHPLLHLLPLQEPGAVLVNKVKRLYTLYNNIRL